MSPFKKYVLIDFRESGRESIERREASLIGCCLPHAPSSWGLNPQPRDVP